jgi:hypothetical protein
MNIDPTTANAETESVFIFFIKEKSFGHSIKQVEVEVV